jgi:hypothetical protein
MVLQHCLNTDGSDVMGKENPGNIDKRRNTWLGKSPWLSERGWNPVGKDDLRWGPRKILCLVQESEQNTHYHNHYLKQTLDYSNTHFPGLLIFPWPDTTHFPHSSKDYLETINSKPSRFSLPFCWRANSLWWLHQYSVRIFWMCFRKNGGASFWTLFQLNKKKSFCFQCDPVNPLRACIQHFWSASYCDIED